MSLLTQTDNLGFLKSQSSNMAVAIVAVTSMMVELHFTKILGPLPGSFFRHDE